MRLEEFSEAEFQKALQRTIRALTRGKQFQNNRKLSYLEDKAELVRQRFIGLSKRNFKAISLSLMVKATVLNIPIT